jgi:hypothetical protein
MTAPVTALGSARRRFTGSVLVDVSGYVDDQGWLTYDGQCALWSGLAGARGLRVRLEIGPLRFVPLATDALNAAYGCTSVEVSGTDPDGVAELVDALRKGDTK